MPVRAACPHCKTVYNLPDEHVGVTLRCRQCQQPFRVPKPPATVPPAPAAAPAPKAPQTKPPEEAPLSTGVTTAPARVPPIQDDDEIPVLEVFSEPKNAKKQTTSPPGDRPRARKKSYVGLLLGCLGAFVLFGVCGTAGLVVVARSVWKKADSSLAAAAGGGAAEEPGPAPAPPPAAIQAAPLPGEKTTLALPGSVRDTCVGGGGRYLILHLPQQRQLAVFDVNEAKVVKYLPTAEDRLLFAAGLDKLLVVFPDKNLVQRWSLTTFERDVTAPLGVQGKVFTAGMGSASDGPLILGGPELRGAGGLPLRFLDVTTLKEVEVTLQERQGVGMVGTHPQHPHVMRVSADGRVIGMWNPGLSPSGLQTVVLNGTGVQAFSDHTSVGHVIPGPDGRTVFTGTGLFTTEVKKLGGAERGGFMLPAVHGSYYLSVANAPGVWPPGNGGKPSVAVHMVGDARPLVTLTDLDGLAAAGDPFAGNRDALPLEKRLFLVPLGKLMVIIPPTADKLHLQRFDLDEALEKAGVDYLFVTSQPPGRFKPGETFSYQLAVKSKKGGLKYKVESGPPGMKVSPEGRVNWPVPADLADAAVDVILTVGDAAGQEVFHTFKLKNAIRQPQVRAPEPAPQVAEAPKEPPPPQRPTTRKEPARVVEQPEANPPPLPPPDPELERPAPKKPAAEPVKGEPLVRVPANPLPIDPAPLPDPKTAVSLPGTIRELCVGGGGRFLIMHLPQQRQLAVFDTSAAKLVKYIPVAEDNLLFAAGMDKLLVVFPDKNLVQRWSLTTFERDVTATLPVTGRIHTAAMGSSSDGPLVLGGPELRGAGGLPLRFLDVTTLKQIVPQAGGQGGGMVGTHPQYPHVMRVSADGHVIGMWNNGLSPSGLETVVLTGNSASAAYEHESVGSVIPGPDGRTVFTGAGLCTPELKKMAGEAHGGLLLPAVHGNYYVSVTGLDAWPPDRNNTKPSVAVYMTGDARPLVTLSDIDGLAAPARGGDPFDRARSSLPVDKRLFLVPMAKLLVTIPATADKLHLQRFDLDEALEKAGIDYLLVTSPPVTSAVKGQEYAYPLAVKAKKGGVKYKVESGPEGMKVSPEGRVTWAVPKDFAEAEVNVILTVSDAAGQEVFHTFKIGIKDKAEPAAPALAEGNRPEAAPAKPKEANKLVELKLPQAAEAVAGLKPTPLEQDVEERKLPGTVSYVCVGGGGRFLILHLAGERKLAVFDGAEGKVVKYLPAAEDGIKFAAGMDKLVVYLPTGNILQRWSLATFEREVAAPCPVQGGIAALAMGSASQGPLVLARTAGQNFGLNPALMLLDPVTFKESGYKLGAGASGFGNDGYGARLAVSADGQVIVSPGDRRTLVLEGQTYKGYPGGMGLPGPDSRTLFTHGQLFTVEGKPLGQHVGGHGSMVWHVPALQAPYYVTLNEKRDGANGRQRLDLGVHIVGDSRPLVTLPKLAALEGMVDWHSGQTQAFERHVFLIPGAQLLVVIPSSKDKLVLHRVNMDQEFEKAGVDFLFVTSQPPTVTGKGADYTYQLAVKSKKGGVKAKLDAGPAGMTLSPEGKLTWPVAKDFAEASVNVVLTIGDSSGQEVFHTFHITVKD
jgi:predicted Zn-dependent protease with MMP-like domain